MKDNEALEHIKKYWPLLCLLLVTLLAASAINWQLGGGMRIWMHYFMGIFLLIFSTLKLFHPIDFADGFQKYDILAKRSRIYAYAYPLIELTLALAYLSFSLYILTYIVTIGLLGFGAYGVVQALQEGIDMRCPCMGTVLDVPLSTVTLIEDLFMAVMALVLLVIAIVS